MNKRRGAIAFAGRAVLLEPGLLKTWDSLRRWTAACNRPGDAVQLARRLTEQRAGESRSWQILARVLDAKKSRDERLAACDKAMVLSPRSVDIADLKASLLAEDGRFADAIAVCRLPEFGDPPPLALAGREAWLLERTGESAQAFKKMEAILHDEPKYYWGWQVLCEWLANGQNAEKFLTAARDMVKNFPNDVRALNTLSEAQFRSRKKPDGKATLARVLAISPTNEFAGYRLFDVQLGDRQFDEAEKTLELLRKHQDGHWVRQREIVLASHRGEKQRTADLLSSATQWAFADPPPFDAAISELDKIGMLETGDQTLEQLISPRFREAPVPGEIHFTESWMKRFASRKDWRQCRRILRTLKPRNDLWLAAMTAYLNGLATGNKPLSIRLILWRNAKQLRSSTPAWGAMGYALCNIARRSSGHRRAVRWLRDFESPTDLRPWMLSNLAVSLRYLNRTKQALDASRKALTLNPDHTTDWHIVWIALDELLAAQPGDGVARFAAVPRNKLPKRQQFLAALAQLLIDFDRDIKTSPKGAAARARGTHRRRTKPPRFPANPRTQARRPPNRQAHRQNRRRSQPPPLGLLSKANESSIERQFGIWQSDFGEPSRTAIGILFLLPPHPNNRRPPSVAPRIIRNRQHWTAIRERPLDRHHSPQQIRHPLRRQRRIRLQRHIQTRLIHMLNIVNQRPIPQRYPPSIRRHALIRRYPLRNQRQRQLDLVPRLPRTLHAQYTRGSKCNR